MLQLAESAWGVSPDVRFCVDEVMGCDDRVLAVRGAYVGTSGEGGGMAERAIGFVNVVENGRLIRTEVFDPEHRERMLARYRELGGTLEVLGDRPPERWWAEFKRRFDAHDLNGLVELYGEDWALTDHRQVGGDVVSAPSALFQMVFDGTPDVTVNVEEVIACDDRVIALDGTYRGTASADTGGGPFELRFVVVSVIEDGLVRSTDIFEPEDDIAIMARWRELHGLGLLGERPSERIFARWVDCHGRRDIDGLAQIVEDDFVFVDRRQMAWEEQGRQELLGTLRSSWDMTRVLREVIDEVLACDDQLLAARATYVGEAVDGGGEMEFPIGYVLQYSDTGLRRAEQFEHEDTEGMLARYRELGGQMPPTPGERPSERVLEELRQAQNARDYERLADLVTDDWYMVDHRALGWPESHGRERCLADLRSVYDASPDIRLEYEEVLAADDNVAVTLNAWRGRGLKAGEHETRAGAVHLIEGGRWAGVEFYEPDERDAMLARFAELAGRKEVLGGSPPERVWGRYIDSFNASDFDALEQVLAPDYVFEDHRTLGYEPAQGIEAGVGMLRSARKASADLRIEAEEVLACDERVIALEVAWRGRGVKAGELELPMGVVAVIEKDRLKIHELFNPDDRAAIMARYEELTGTRTVLGDRPSERVIAEVQRALNGRDYERLLELVTHDWYFVDHRALGWEEGHGREQCVTIMRSMFDASPDVRFDLDEVLAVDDRLMVTHAAVRGHGLKAGKHEVSAGAVFLVEDGLWAGVDFYEPGDRPAMIARYAELGGGAGALGDLPPERFFARWIPIAAAGDVDGVAELVAEDFVRVDHRSLGWEPMKGREANVALWRSAYENADHIRMEVEEVLACGETVIALRFTWRGVAGGATGGGEFAASVGQVNVIEDGIWRSCDQYDTDDRAAMLARFAELGGRREPAGGVQPPERFYDEYARCWAAKDERIVELVDENWVLADRRSLALWGEMRGREAARTIVKSSFAGVHDPRFTVQEVLACDDTVMAARVAWSGIGRGGAKFSNEMGAVCVVRDGREIRMDVYDPDDRQLMIARYVELGGGLGKLGDTASERLFAEYTRRYARRDLDGLLELMSDAYVQVDYRTLGWDEIGKEQNAVAMRSVWAGTTDIRPEVEEMLAADERGLVCICTYRGSADASGGGGQFEYPVGFLLIVDGERASRVEWFDPEDREAMLARYEELSARAPGLAARTVLRRAEHCNARRLDELRSLYAEGFELTDHRPMPWEAAKGGEEMRSLIEGAFDLSPDARVTAEILDDDGGEVVAWRQTWFGTFGAGGPAESVIDTVTVVRDEQFVRSELFDPDQQDEMRRRLAELRASD
jgi:ketosteroid isomerase-like protein